MRRTKSLSAAAISCSICCLHQSQAFVLKPLIDINTRSTSSNNKSTTFLHQYDNNPQSYGDGGSRNSNNRNNNRNRNGVTNKNGSYQNRARGNQQNDTNPPMPRGGLESSLTNLFDMSDQGSARKYNAQQNRNMAQSILSSSTESQDDAPLLDESMYLNSDQYMDADGSFVGKEKSQIDNDMQYLHSRLMDENPQIPYDDNIDDTQQGDIIDDQALLQSISQNNANKSIDGEELHKRIFENEKGFLQQSEAFRETLGIDPDEKKKIEAAVLRRGVEYRKQQEETMKHIFKEMEELENSVLSMEDARKLAAEQNAKSKMKNILTDPRSGDGMNDDGNTALGQEQDPSTILCSKCACLISGEEIVFERKRARKNSSEMICRLCQVDKMQVKKGSPYLMGRLGRNGKLPPRMGIPAPRQSKIARNKIQQIRKIGPRTEDLNEDIYTKPDEIVENNNEDRTEVQSNAWREKYTNAMHQRRGILTNGTTPVSNTVVRDPPLKQIDQTTSTSTANHRYSDRPEELKKNKETFSGNEVWEAHLKAALHRQQGIEQTGIAYTSRTGPSAAATTKPASSSNTSISTNNNTQSQLSKDTEVTKLRGQINIMERTIKDYKNQMERSSKQIKAMQSMVEGMKKSTNRPVKRTQNPRNTKRVVSDTRARVAKEVGEGVVREIGAGDDEFYLEDP